MRQVALKTDAENKIGPFGGRFRWDYCDIALISGGHFPPNQAQPAVPGAFSGCAIKLIRTHLIRHSPHALVEEKSRAT